MLHALLFVCFVPVVLALLPQHHKSKCSKLQSTIPNEIPGSLAPTGYFDPLRFSATASDAMLKRWRESELKHGRIAMLASLGILVAERWNPFFDGRVTGPAIYHFQQVEALFPPFWYLSLLGIGIIEGYSISKVIAKYFFSNLILR